MTTTAEMGISAQQPQECGNTPYDEGPFTVVQPVTQQPAPATQQAGAI